MSTKTATVVQVERKPLIRALERLVRILPNRGVRPVLGCVRIEARQGLLKLAATDLESALMVQIHGEGDLAPCLVSGRDLLQRVRAGRGPTCELGRDRDHLIVNGGTVSHRLQTEPVKDYPLLVFRPEGRQLSIPMRSFRPALRTAMVAAAREATRYAINGVLLEVSKGGRLVATDGRRMVMCELPQPLEAREAFSVVLPLPLCRLLVRLTDRRDDEVLHLYVKENRNARNEKTPSHLWALGPDWVLQGSESDGHFPHWRDVVPRNDAKFLIDRAGLLALVQEVSTAACETAKGVQVRLEPQRAVLTCTSPGGAASTGEMPCRFLGGGDALILTGFNPGFLIDALATLTGEQVLIEARQNTRGDRHSVAHHPAVLRDRTDEKTRWVIMPVSTGVKPDRESLGSNFKEEAA